MCYIIYSQNLCLDALHACTFDECTVPRELMHHRDVHMSAHYCGVSGQGCKQKIHCLRWSPSYNIIQIVDDSINPA